MNAHDFCRALLRTTIASMREPDPVRFIKAEVNGKAKLGGDTHYWIDVTDHRDPQTGTRFPGATSPGHFRAINYEVVGCCAANAKTEALNEHAAKFDANATRGGVSR